VIWREKLRYGRQHPGLVPNDGLIVRKASDADFQIFFENGSVITGKSADSGREKFQGASVDLIWIDEECEVEVFDECYQRTVDCRGKILLTLTPLTDIASGVRTPWVFDLYEDFKGGKADVMFVQLSVLDNPYVPEEEKTKLLEKWKDHPEEKARLYGSFVQRSGLIYSMWKPAKHLISRYRLPSDIQRIVCLDPAATGTTAALWAAVNDKGDITLEDEYYERDKIVSDHAKGILLKNGGRRVDIWLIDPKWGTQRNAETHKQNMQLYRESGIPVRLAVVGEDYGMNASREYMNATLDESARHPKVYVFNDLHHFRFEVEHYVWAFFSKGESKGLSKDKPLKRNDHLLNCFQYIAAQRPRGKGRPILTEQQKLLNSQVNSYT
jgi:phage terminase large subunit-like protein